MKNQNSTSILNSQQAHSFTEIERLKYLNELLKNSNPNIEVKFLESLNNFKLYVEHLKTK